MIETANSIRGHGGWPRDASASSLVSGERSAPPTQRPVTPRPVAADQIAAPPVRYPSPLIAVCGLTGGIGTSTLALLAAHALSADASGPVLLCELDGAGGGLAELAGASSPRSLTQLAAGIRGRGLPFVALDRCLRLIATPPHSPLDVSDQALVAV